MNYRKLYIKELGLNELPKNFEIHHIDGDRGNNDILNIVALPKELHKKYHQSLSKNVFLFTLGIETKIDSDYNTNFELANTIIEFEKVRFECLKWVKKRDSLLHMVKTIIT